MPKTVGIIQARMASSRLPGKVLLDIVGQPMIVRVVERVKRAKTIDRVVIATTTDPSDDPINDLCERRGYAYYRGNQFNVLDRYYQAAQLYSAGIIVRITADCPLIDPEEIDHVVQVLLEKKSDFAANRLPPPWERTYPIGLDTEVCTFEALECAWNEAQRPEELEHVMPYLYTQEGRFRVVVLNYEVNYGHYRWAVDTQKDLELIRQIYTYFDGKDDFSWFDVIDLYDRHPELGLINAEVRHKTLKDVDNRLGAIPRESS
jgi:spore coat polysaccharide biosynthesis protein SpsF